MLYINEKLVKNPDNIQKIVEILNGLEDDVGTEVDYQKKDALLKSIKDELGEDLVYQDIVDRLYVR